MTEGYNDDVKGRVRRQWWRMMVMVMMMTMTMMMMV